MKKYILYGFLIGVLLSVCFILFGKHLQQTLFLDFLVIISTPLAHLISWIKGWPLEQEAAITIYVYAILLTLPLYGILTGILIGFIKRRKKFREISG